MSGIFGILQRDGAPADRPTVCALTKFLSFRGPDAQDVWCDGSIGFGHTMLRTTREAAMERQPASLAGRFWITADVRLDCRKEFIETLRQAGCEFDRRAITDPELILHAYATWREDCVQYLRGDFAFALWDGIEQKLFCARDHFGVKPFFYSVSENQFLLSNTLNCLRAHPAISDELNDAAIADFLVFGLNCDIARTTFRDIQRLPPAHFLCVSRSAFRTERYWSPPAGGRIRYARPADYVQNFREILKSAVTDRMRLDRVGIFLSGGMDSGCIAAMATQASSDPRGAKDLRGYTTVFRSLLYDDDGDYARETARSLGIPQTFSARDDLKLFDRWDDPEMTPPEPVDSPFVASFVDFYRMVSSECRVVLSGEGGDYLMCFQMLPYAADLLRRGEWQTFAAEMSKFLWVRPFPWRGIRYRLSRLLGLDASAPEFPQWIKPDLAKRLNLKERWARDPSRGAVTNTLLPKAYASLTSPHWLTFFEMEDAGFTRRCIESRHPFLDLRMVNYMLAIPPFPWLFQKKVARDATKNLLPERVRLRPKTPLSTDPLQEVLRRGTYADGDRIKPAENIQNCVDWTRLPPLRGEDHPERSRRIVRAHCLNLWLQSACAVGYKLSMGVENG